MSSNKRPPDGSSPSCQGEKSMRDGYSQSPTASLSESNFPHLDQVVTSSDSCTSPDYATNWKTAMISQQVSLGPNDVLSGIEVEDDYDGPVDQDGCRIYPMTDTMTNLYFVKSLTLDYKDNESQYKLSLSLDNLNSRPCYYDGRRWIEDSVAPSSKTFQQHIQLGQKTGFEWNSGPVSVFITFTEIEDPHYFRISEKVKYFFRLKVENVNTGVYVYVHFPIPFLATYSPASGFTRMYGPIPVFPEKYREQLRLISPEIREVFKWNLELILETFYKKKLKEHAIGYPSYYEMEVLALITRNAPAEVAYWFAFQNGHELRDNDHVRIIKSLIDTDVLAIDTHMLKLARYKIQAMISSENKLSGQGLLNITPKDFTKACNDLLHYHNSGANEKKEYQNKLKHLSEISTYSKRDIFLHLYALRMESGETKLIDTVNNYRLDCLEPATREEIGRFCDDYKIGREYIGLINRALFDCETAPMGKIGLDTDDRKTLLGVFNENRDGLISFYEKTLQLDISTEQIFFFYQEKNRRRVRKDMIEKQMKNESMLSEDPFGVRHSNELLNYEKIPLGQPLYDCKSFQLNLLIPARWIDDGSGCCTKRITEREPAVIDNEWFYIVDFADKESTFRVKIILNPSRGRANVLEILIGEHTGHYWEQQLINLSNIKMCLRHFSSEAVGCFHVTENVMYTPTIEIQNIHTGKSLTLSHSTDIIFVREIELKEFFNKKAHRPDQEDYQWDGQVSSFELDQLQLMLEGKNHDRILNWLKYYGIQSNIDCKEEKCESDLVTFFRWADRSKRDLLKNVDHKQLNQVFSHSKNPRYNSEPEMENEIRETEVQVNLRRRQIQENLLSEEKFLLMTFNWKDREKAIQHVCDVLTVEPTTARRWFVDHEFQTCLDNTPVEGKDHFVQEEYRKAMDDKTLSEQLQYAVNAFSQKELFFSSVNNYDLSTYVIMERLRVLNNIGNRN